MIKPDYSLFIIWLLILTACAGTKKEPGYYRTQQTVSSDSAVKLKSNLFHAVSNNYFEPFTFTGSNHTIIPYRLLRPLTTHKDKTTKYPLVLILHSSGAIGTDNTSQLGILAKLWAQPAIRNKYPAYVVAPQFSRRSSNYQMDKSRNVLTSE